MMARKAWFERVFTFDLPLWMLPMVIERLRGTPARLEDRLRWIDRDRLTAKTGESWSAQEHLGHLLDLEPLFLGRVEDCLASAEYLRDADLTNRRTHEANHNATALDALLAEFREARSTLVDRVEDLNAETASLTALHPRLKKPMRILDLLLFMAEHDDHHLASITENLSRDA